MAPRALLIVPSQGAGSVSGSGPSGSVPEKESEEAVPPAGTGLECVRKGFPEKQAQGIPCTRATSFDWALVKDVQLNSH